ncbi:LAFE_0B09120g1_1 [Lachancea fermentati]|uniref:LAFE_0B09120g1_1 n=1 Tax=Lachancea fermentati TaxID=4955 RepID=A0A1G4M8E1_LACFM|nr:LAFE_0B09120g1_1 [Lachancea fermentati]
MGIESMKHEQPQMLSAESEIGEFSSNGTAGESPRRPVIEIATYAGVDVYECYCRGQESRIVMRRCMDNWVNITQVFKIASFTKTQRTKILEKESNMVKHEKIQGGYGRFQGTWIPLENAHYLVQKYSISDNVVLTILHFQLDPRNPPLRRSKNSIIKRQSPGTKIQSPSSYNKTPKKIGGVIAKKTKKKGVNGAKKLQLQPSPLQNLVFQTPQHQQQQNSQNNNSTVVAQDQQTPLQMNSYETTQKPLQFFPYPQQQPAFLTFDSNNYNQHQAKKQKKSAKRATGQSQAQQSFQIIKQQFRDNLHTQSKPSAQTVVIQTQPASHKPTHSSGSNGSNGSNGSHGSSIECFSANENPTPMSSRSISPKLRHQQLADSNSDRESNSVDMEEYKELLLEVLSSDYSGDDQESIVLPEPLFHPPSELDINFIIDDQGHTTLHWAAALSNVPLLKLVISLSANILQCNDRGFTAITKACFYNNCFKAGVFPQVLELLKPCLITPDMNGRLPLHYLVELSVNKSKDPVVINYYMDSILDVLQQEDIALLRMCLNYQDNMGNTVLHLAALNLNLELCNKLCYLGSSMDIINLEHETATSILARFNLVPPTSQQIDGLPHAFVSNAQPQEKQMKLSTPVRTRKKSNSFMINDEHTVNLTHELSSFSTTEDSILTSSVMKNPVGSTAIKTVEPWSVLTSVGSSNKTVKPTIKLNREGSSQVLTKQLSELTATLTTSVDEKIGSLELEKEKTQECIESIQKSLKLNDAHQKEVLGEYTSAEELKEAVKTISKQLSIKMAVLANSSEKSQALALATLAHEEEAKMNTEGSSPERTDDSSPNKVINEELVKLGLHLTLLQFGRKHMIDKIARAKCEINSSPKIKKYRKLIGLTIDDIDSKLDDIEQDLRASA